MCLFETTSLSLCRSIESTEEILSSSQQDQSSSGVLSSTADNEETEKQTNDAYKVNNKHYTSIFSSNSLPPPPPFPIIHYWHESCLNCATKSYEKLHLNSTCHIIFSSV